MDLSTTYMGTKLKSPVVMSAGPLTREPSNIRVAEDAGVGAIVFHSLFEEEITHEIKELHHHLSSGTDSFPEALDYFPEPEVFHRTTDDYMRLIQKAKEAVDIPIIGSLNGVGNPEIWQKHLSNELSNVMGIIDNQNFDRLFISHG